MGKAVHSSAEDAPAKINLALHVLGRRSDGYHNLDSLVVFADIADRLKIVDSDEAPDLAIDGPFAPALRAVSRPGDNLVRRTAYEIAVRTGMPTMTRFRLTKNIPVGAGLGGGSADAAAALRLLAPGKLNNVDIRALAKTLGADVPMCMESVPVHATGVGADTHKVDMPSLPIVLVFPGVSVGTGEVFGGLQNPADLPLPALPGRFRSTEDVVHWLSQTINGLEAAAVRIAPAIDLALSRLGTAPASLLTRMSGSGSACFAVFSTHATAESAAALLQRSQPTWWVRATATRGSV